MKELTHLRGKKDLLVSSPEVKKALTHTSSQVEKIVPKKELDFQNMMVQDVAKLSNNERLEAAQAFLQKKELSPKQQEAILQAHKVGENRV